MITKIEKSTYVIYKHTSPSGKSYIGQTKDLTSRNQHCNLNLEKI